MFAIGKSNDALTYNRNEMSKVGKVFYGDLYYSETHPQKEQRFDIIETVAVTKGESKEALKSMKRRKPPGEDGIRLLKG